MDASMLLASGQYFNFMSPAGFRFDVEVIAHALSNTCRFGGHTKSFYSVAQHSVLVSQNVSKPNQLQALFHDGSEAFLGDVIKPLKDLLTDYAEIEERVQREVFRSVGVSLVMHPEVKHADKVVLATERRDLMLENLQPWELIKGIAPMAEFIAPLEPREARRLFLDRYSEIMRTALAVA